MICQKIATTYFADLHWFMELICWLQCIHTTYITALFRISRTYSSTWKGAKERTKTIRKIWEREKKKQEKEKERREQKRREEQRSREGESLGEKGSQLSLFRASGEAKYKIKPFAIGKRENTLSSSITRKECKIILVCAVLSSCSSVTVYLDSIYYLWSNTQRVFILNVGKVK